MSAKLHGPSSRPFVRLAHVLIALAVGGCATRQEAVSLPATAVENVVYYPFLVKGYQNTYPQRRLSVIPVVDARDARTVEGSMVPREGHPLIGVVLDKQGKIAERLYGPAVDALTQEAVVKSADEAGMTASSVRSDLSDVLKKRKTDYVLSGKIIRFWVTRNRVSTTNGGSGTWRTDAQVQLEVAIYKPPFEVAFWQGESSGNFVDPPSSMGMPGINDSVTLYEHPGEDLSVAFSRAVAGIFKRDDLRTLISEDTVPTH